MKEMSEYGKSCDEQEKDQTMGPSLPPTLPLHHKLPFKSSQLTLNAGQRPSYGVG